MTMGLLFDATRCVGCGACASACKEQNHLPGAVEAQTTAYTWTTVEPKEGLYVRHLCMHCLVPTCASVCPVAALKKTPEGPVVYDSEKCMGCRYCMMACPFDVPKYQWDRAVPIVGKCILCTSRVKDGKPTACAEACPADATIFGSRADLIKEAKKRIRENPTGYIDHIYGQAEAGGTSVMMISSVPFEKLGLKKDLPGEPPALRTWQVLSNIPDFVAVWGVFLYGVHWITARRDVVAQAHSRPKPGGPDEPQDRRPS
ncbi:MAG TPA: 4Fe-4S dicluster domain-containing protein [Holophagaceae bacterium]|nr:4Fe-4S dicluster domain-containing protein [Holophagaceae bacterium]